MAAMQTRAAPQRALVSDNDDDNDESGSTDSTTVLVRGQGPTRQSSIIANAEQESW